MEDGGCEGGYSGEEKVKRSETITIMIEELEKAEMIIFDKLVG